MDTTASPEGVPAAAPDPEFPPVPADTKDWTWVMERPCPECGFVAAEVTPDRVGAAVRDAVPRYVAALGRADARTRPDPTTWSVLEYAAHVRDVFTVFDVRVQSMVEGDDPRFANWDQDATAVAEDYAHQDPAVVARGSGSRATASRAASTRSSPTSGSVPAGARTGRSSPSGRWGSTSCTTSSTTSTTSAPDARGVR